MSTSVDAEGTAPATPSRLLVHAGTLIDGVSDDTRSDVTVVVEGDDLYREIRGEVGFGRFVPIVLEFDLGG